MNADNFYAQRARAFGPIIPASPPVVIEIDQAGNATLAHWGGTTLPTGAGYAVGCLLIDRTNAVLYINQGTASSASFVALTPATGGGSLTVPTGKTLTVTDADALTEGGVIVPQLLTVPFTIAPHASAVTYTLFQATNAYQVVAINVVPDLVQGSSITATLVKAAINTIPASGTTPLHAAGGINTNATANTTQAITLSSTTADLKLAATDKIGIVFSGAKDTGILSGTIVLKRI